jgi:hypothetical protein
VQVNVGNDIRFQAYNHGEGRYQGKRDMHHGYRDMHSPDNRRYQDYTIASDFPPGGRCEYASGWRKENQMFPTVRGPEKPGMFCGRRWRDNRHSRDDGMTGPGGMGGMCGMGGVGGMGGKGGVGVGDMYISSPTMPQFSGGGANHNGERVGDMGYSDQRRHGMPECTSTPVMSRARGSWTPPVRCGPHNSPNVTRAAPAGNVPRGQDGQRRGGRRRARHERQAGTRSAEAENRAQGEVVEQEDDDEGNSEDDDEVDSSSGS